MSSEQLIPIDQIVKLSGIDKIHLAYLSKLHLIPSAIRRKLANGKIAGCYPESVVATVQKIEDLKNRGFSYSQIRAQLALVNSTTQVQANKFNLALAFSGPVFLIIGVILGYLLAGNNNKQPVMATLSENDYQKVLKVAPVNHDNQEIYVISVPNQGLYKLGKMDLTSLIN